MTQKYQVKVSMKQAAIVETGIVLKQGDFGIQIEIEVLDFDATGTTPQIVFRKAQGAVESTTITVSGNKYTYTFVGTELDTPGKCFCDLKLKNSTTQRISTASFMFKVVADTLDGLAEEASSYSDTIEQLLENTLQKSEIAGLVKNDGTIDTETIPKVDLLNKDIGELGDAIGDTLGTFIIPRTQEYMAVDCGGDTVTMSSGVPVASQSWNYNCRLIACQYGDIYIITGKGGTTSRLYAFVDSSGNILEKAGQGATASNLMVKAPTSTAWLIVNTKTDTSDLVFSSENLIARVNDIESTLNAEAKASLNIANILYENKVPYGFLSSTGVDDPSATDYWNTGLIEIPTNRSALKAATELYKVAFYDSIRTLISVDTTNQKIIQIPDGTRYIKVQIANNKMQYQDSGSLILYIDNEAFLHVNYQPVTYKEQTAKKRSDSLFSNNGDSIFKKRVPYGFQTSDGSDSTSATGFWNTGLINIGKGKNILNANYPIYKTAFFDENQIFISTDKDNHKNIEIPQNTQFAKIQLDKNVVPYIDFNFDNLQIIIDGKIVTNIIPQVIEDDSISIYKLDDDLKSFIQESGMGYTEAYYSGEPIVIKPKLKYKNNGYVYAQQGGCIYNNTLFRFNTDKSFQVFNLETSKHLYTGTLGGNVAPHCNSAEFGNEFYNSEDSYPLLYVNAYNAPNLPKGTCYVHRIKSDYTTELLQTIQIGFTDSEVWTDGSGDSRPYGNFCIDKENNKLYVYTLLDTSQKTRFFEFDLPTLSDGDVIFQQSDIIKMWDCDWFANIQDNCFNNGKIYLSTGMGTEENNGFIRVVDVNKEEEISVINLNAISLAMEPEFIDIYNELLYFGWAYCYKVKFDI